MRSPIGFLLATVILSVALSQSFRLHPLKEGFNAKKKHDMRVYVLFHDDKSKQIASSFDKYDWSVPYQLGKSIYMESAFLPYLASVQEDWEKKDYVGMITYNIMRKQVIDQDIDMREIVNASDGADFIAFYGLSVPNMVDYAEDKHPGFKNIWVKLLTKMGFSKEDIDAPISFFQCNCWMAKPEWMVMYLDFARRAMTILDEDQEIKALCYRDASYTSNLSEDQLMKIYGAPWYTFHPFIMERLPCFFVKQFDAKLYAKNIGPYAAEFIR